MCEINLTSLFVLYSTRVCPDFRALTTMRIATGGQTTNGTQMPKIRILTIEGTLHSVLPLPPVTLAKEESTSSQNGDGSFQILNCQSSENAAILRYFPNCYLDSPLLALSFAQDSTFRGTYNLYTAILSICDLNPRAGGGSRADDEEAS